MTDMITFPTYATKFKLRGESSVLSHNSELSPELIAKTNSPERQGRELDKEIRRHTERDRGMYDMQV